MLTIKSLCQKVEPILLEISVRYHLLKIEALRAIKMAVSKAKQAVKNALAKSN